MSSTFKLITEHKIKTLEEETMLGLYEIIDRMHKHAVKDYINVISCYYDEDLDEVKSVVEFDKIFRKNFFEMFEHIESDLQFRVKNLKSQLIKRFDIKSDSYSESDSESDSESESESESKSENKNLKIIPESSIELKLPDDGKSESKSENKKIETQSLGQFISKMVKEGKYKVKNGKII